MSQDGPEGTPGGQPGDDPDGGQHGQWPGQQPPAADGGQQNGSPFARQNGSPFAHQNGSPFAHRNGSAPGYQNGSAAGHPNGPAAAGPYAALPGQPFGYPGAAPPRPGVPVPGTGRPGPREQSDDRAWATAAYLTPLVVSFLGPLMIYILKKNESPFVRHHAAQALNLVITAIIYSAILLGLGAGAAVAGHRALFVLGFLLWLLLVLVYLVCLIVATLGANRSSEPYRAPGWLGWRFVR
ncbi:MAG TPA: DUF4870 domain-containing protein [Streptosporangiaceae bacterium]|nr:DUF4870 domain-containing protein [Streptosporangiaceae bacterium]